MLEIVEDVKLKLTDQEYKSLVDAMMRIHRMRPQQATEINSLEMLQEYEEGEEDEEALREWEALRAEEYDEEEDGEEEIVLQPQAPIVVPATAPAAPGALPPRWISTHRFIFNTRTRRHIQNTPRNRRRLLADGIINEAIDGVLELLKYHPDATHDMRLVNPWNDEE